MPPAINTPQPTIAKSASCAVKNSTKKLHPHARKATDFRAKKITSPQFSEKEQSRRTPRNRVTLARHPTHFHCPLYAICTVYVRYLYASEAYKYRTNTVHIAYNGRSRYCKPACYIDLFCAFADDASRIIRQHQQRQMGQRKKIFASTKTKSAF